MKIGFKTAKCNAWRRMGGLGLVLAATLALAAQSPVTVTPGSGVAASALAISGTMILDGPWRFQAGDDPRWADAGYDDSTWPTLALRKAITEQGFDPYTGYGWYRLRLSPEQLAQFKTLPGNPQLDLMVSSDSVGQLGVYLNGDYTGHTEGMTDRPDMYQSPPLVVH